MLALAEKYFEAGSQAAAVGRSNGYPLYVLEQRPFHRLAWKDSWVAIGRTIPVEPAQLSAHTQPRKA
jgi:hypothetical protein